MESNLKKAQISRKQAKLKKRLKIMPLVINADFHYLGKNSKRISEGSKNFSEAVKNNIMASGASDAGQRKTADVGWENNLKGNAVIIEACTTEEETYKDASLKVYKNASELSNEMNNNNANVSFASLN
ncbi:hypothetical protein ACET3Z_022494 [Daucus carota]